MTNQAPPRTDVASLTYGDRSVDLPLVHGTEDEVAADISKLRGDTGLITLDVGYGNTGATRSAITFLDGEQGILRYRGYPIEELAEQQHLPGGRLPAHLRRAADPRRAGPLRGRDHASHPHPRGDAALLRLVPARRAPDGGARLRHGGDEHLLPRQPRDRRCRRGGAHHAAADRQAADPGRLVVQEGDRPALRLPAQRPGLRGQPAAHDVRRRRPSRTRSSRRSPRRWTCC